VRVVVMLPALLVLTVAACGDDNTPPDAGASSTLSPLTPVPQESQEPSTTGTGGGPTGFDTVLVRISAADGTTCERCMWLADDREERARGLMGVTDLGGLDGMAFRYDDPDRRTFWMKNTLLPLSIAFVGGDGSVVGSADMAPCRADPCPSYGPDEPFVVAIEVEQGRLAELGIGPDSVVELVGDCPG
jgi:uncharacterized membrane protein (UPF0127 family)